MAFENALRGPRNDYRMKKLFSSLLPGSAADARGAQKTKRINLALQGAAPTAPSPGACSNIC